MAGPNQRKISDKALLPELPTYSNPLQEKFQRSLMTAINEEEFFRRPPPPAAPLSFSRRMTFILLTIVMTARSSLGVSFVLALGFSLAALLIAPVLLDHAAVWQALTTFTLQPVAHLWPAVVIAALAIGFGLEALRSMAGYVWKGREWTLKKLRQLLPSIRVIQQADVASLRLYVTGLRTAAFTAYVCETAFQFIAIGIVIWGVESVTPNFHLFTRPDDVTPWSAVVFLAQVALDNFGLKELFQVSWTSLTSTGVFSFSLFLWVFQVFLVGVLAKEIWYAWHIKPEDISEALHDALNR